MDSVFYKGGVMERIEGAFVYVLYALAAISGGVGGCAVTAQHFLRDGGAGKVQMRISWLLAYGIIGGVFGVLCAAYMLTFGELTDPHQIVPYALLAGITGTSSLTVVNVTARFVLKRLGVEVIVTVRRDKEDRRTP